MKPFVTKIISTTGTLLCILYISCLMSSAIIASSQKWDTSGTSEYDMHEGTKCPNLLVVAIYTIPAVVYLVPWFRYFNRIQREGCNPDFWPFDLDINVAAKSILTIVYVLLTLGILYSFISLPWAQATVVTDAGGLAYRDFDIPFFDWFTAIVIGTPIYGLLSMAGIRVQKKWEL